MAARLPRPIMTATKEVVVIEFLGTNWLWFVVVGLFVAMHLTGHGCGMHGGHHHGRHADHERHGEPR